MSISGCVLGNHEGIFNPFEFDITDYLQEGAENELLVRDSAPRDETEYINAGTDRDTPLSEPYQRHQAKAITQIKGHMIDAMHRPGAMTSFRQDGNSAGIWDQVELVKRPDKFIEYAKISTRIVLKKDWAGDGQDKDTGSALVSMDVTLNNQTDAPVKGSLRALILPANFGRRQSRKRQRDRSAARQDYSKTCGDGRRRETLVDLGSRLSTSLPGDTELAGG